MLNIKRKQLKMVLLGMSIAMAPALSTAAGSCGSSCVVEARQCISDGNDYELCLDNFASCMKRSGCEGWS